MALRALHRDGAAVRLDDVLHNGQAQAAAPFVARPALAHALEAFEQARQMLCRDADAVVAHLHQHTVTDIE